MTLDALLTAARAAGPWTRTRRGALRNVNGECPICAAANRAARARVYENWQVFRAADALGLDRTLAAEIAASADGEHGARVEVREAVLALAREGRP